MQLALKSRVAGASARPARASRATPVVRASTRPVWYPGATPPSYLNGTLAGDRGFDPLRLGVNPDNLKWFKEAELYNGRVAMMAVAGILFQEAFVPGNWWEAGAKTYALDNQTLLAIELITFAILEGKRVENFKKTGETGFLGWAPFDPLNMRSDEMRLKEVKNGRLAMIAFVGFASEAAVRGKGPIACLNDHLADPGHVNIYTSSVGKESIVTVVLLCILPMIIEGIKEGQKGKESVPYFPWTEPWNAK